MTDSGRTPIVRLAKRWAPALVWMAFIFALSANPDPPVPHLGSQLLDLITRKLGHATEYAILALLFLHALRGRPWAVLLALLLASGYGASDEWHQTFVPPRDGNPVDWAIDTTGAAVGLVLAFRFARSEKAKRIVDIVGALLGVLLCSPLMLSIAIAIRLDSPGPILFRQWRAGKDGKPFRILKFRSMIDGAEQMRESVLERSCVPPPIFKVPRDPRVTRVGRFLRRFSLDELPQFWNVLKGQMSLVGPRPEELDIVARYDERQRRRLAVRPGMTGPMQLRGRGALSLDERVQVELEYIDCANLWEDLAMLARTVPAIVRGEGAY